MGKQKTTTQLDELIQKGINPTESFFDEWSEKLTLLCQHYCPDSVSKIPRILEKYNNHQMMKGYLRQKFFVKFHVSERDQQRCFIQQAANYSVPQRLELLCVKITKNNSEFLCCHGQYNCCGANQRPGLKLAYDELHRSVSNMKQQADRRDQLGLSEDASMEECEARENAHKHIKRCQKLGLPSTTKPEECLAVEIKLKQEQEMFEKQEQERLNMEWKERQRQEQERQTQERERKMHIERCKKLGLPSTADTNQCEVEELKRAQLEKERLHEEHSQRCEMLGLPPLAPGEHHKHWKFPSRPTVDTYGDHGMNQRHGLASKQRFGSTREYQKSITPSTKICESCETKEATLYCQNDKAVFCDECDQHQHQHKISMKHHRVPLEERLEEFSDTCPKCQATFDFIHCPFGAGTSSDGSNIVAVTGETTTLHGDIRGVLKCCRASLRVQFNYDGDGMQWAGWNITQKGCHMQCACSIINVGCTLCCEACGELKVQYLAASAEENSEYVGRYQPCDCAGTPKYCTYNGGQHRKDDRRCATIVSIAEDCAGISEDIVACHCENPMCTEGNNFCFTGCGRCSVCALKMEAECCGVISASADFAKFCGSGNHCGCDFNTCERCNCCLNCPKDRGEYKGPACSQCPELCSNCTFACPSCSESCENCNLVRCTGSSSKKCSGFTCSRCGIHGDTFCDGCNKCAECIDGGVDEKCLCNACRE